MIITIVVFFNGYTTKKVMVPMLLPSFMVTMLWKRRWQHVAVVFLFFYFFSPFGLVHQNWQLTMKWWFFLTLKVVVARRRRLKKGGSDLEAHKQNVLPSVLRIDKWNNLCGLKLTIVIICNSNDEITLHINWEFWSKNGGLDWFRIYVH